MESCGVNNYLKNGLVVNIFYLHKRSQLKDQLLRYLLFGTESLTRKHIQSRGQKNEIKICEYKCYKVLTFLDVIRNTSLCGVFASIYNFILFDYLVDYILSSCDIDCVKCSEHDFTTHYIKNERFSSVKLVYDEYDCSERFVLTLHDEFPYRNAITSVVGKSNDYTSSMMLLDFNKVYRVVALRKISRGSKHFYIITLFNYVEHLDHIMICDFWLPKPCLSKIIGYRNSVDKNGYVNIVQNQFIYVVGTEKCNSKCGGRYGDFCVGRRVEIKSITEKTINQLARRKNNCAEST